MSLITRHTRLLLVGLCCLAAGAGASAIASAGASTASGHHRLYAGHHARGLHGLARRAVHGSFVIHTPSGWRTVTFDRGTVESVSANQLTVKDGTRKASYQTVTLTIPSSARIRDNRHVAKLSSVTPGQRVIVVQGLKRTLVIAHTPRSH